MKKEGKMGADDDRKPLGEVPVPGVRAVEIGHAVQDVKLEEVELNQRPLTKTEKSSTYIRPHKHFPITSNLFEFYLFIENTVDHGRNHQN